MTGGSGALVGRDPELAVAETFLEASTHRPAALVLTGAAGIGKTTLWSHTLSRAAAAAVSILVARPGEHEAEFAYSGLADLVRGRLDDVWPALAQPQSEALSTALMLADSPAAAPSPHAVASAFLAVLQLSAQRGPLLVAVDDLQWLDPPSAAVLRFALRRLADEPVGLVATRRGRALDDDLDLRRSFADDSRFFVELGPVGVTDLHRILRVHLDCSFARPILRRIHDASGGNPFYALEIARAVVHEHVHITPGMPLPVPESLHELVVDRIHRLPADVLYVVQAAACATEPTLELLDAASSGPGRPIDVAIQAGLVELDGTRVRFSHPLLASSVRQAMGPQELMAMHRQLATLVDDLEQRARHLALATAGADEKAAAALEQAWELAARRGVLDIAGELAELAAAKTPRRDDSARRRRLLAAADLHVGGGDPARAREIYESLTRELAPGPDRASVLVRLSGVVGDDLELSARLCHQALDEARGTPALRAEIYVAMATYSWLAGALSRSADELRLAAIEADAADDDQMLAAALADLAHAETVLGRGIPHETIGRAVEIEQRSGEFPVYFRPSFQLGVLYVYTDRLDDARPLLAEHLDRVTAAGDAGARAGVLFRLAELELRAGNWAAARQHADECVALAAQSSIEQEYSVALMVDAMVKAHQGDLDEAVDAARQSIDLATAARDRMVWIRNVGTIGLVELSRGDAAAVDRELTPAMDLLLEMGVGEHSTYGVVHNHIEALIALGEIDRARSLIDHVRETASVTHRSWSLAVASRGEALVSAAAGDMERARAALDDALIIHEDLPQPFELARTLLVMGTIERRAKHKRIARETLLRAQDIFDRLGPRQWSARTTAELSRIGGRAASAFELTPTEERLAQLVAEGRTNQQVADVLFMSVNTVEGTLTRIYRKLGVRSRTELSARVAGRT